MAVRADSAGSEAVGERPSAGCCSGRNRGTRTTGHLQNQGRFTVWAKVGIALV
jgi:hypothetical protein